MTGVEGAFGSDLTCPGDAWPPFGAPGTFDGIVARSTDWFHLEIRSRTRETVFVRVSGWEVAQLEACRGLLELEVVRGPVRPGTVFIAKLPSEPWDSPLTVGIWREPCGEACREGPIALLPVSRSTIEPASS
ncbi:MAG: hypothetical protein H0U52_18390 [Chloroflexi bacterium]|nr:hypothetical protein [Chloroflexota bacterium]